MEFNNLVMSKENKYLYFDDYAAQEANALLDAIRYERLKAKDVKWHLLKERIKYLRKNII